MSQDIFEQVNLQRAANGSAPLSYCTGLQDAADLRAEECSELFSHTRPDGSACFTAFNVPFYAAGENIAANSTRRAGADTFMTMWMNSDGHRANILNSDFSSVAVGIYHDPDSGLSYATQLFVG